MRNYDAATLSYFQSREGITARHLLWVIGRNRTTGVDETIGIWNGSQDQSFTINSVSRDYTAAGALMGFEPIRATVGLDVQIHNFTMSGLADDVETLVRTYDPRLGRVEAHRALYTLDTNELVAEPFRIFKGFVNEITFTTGEEEGGNEVVLSVASASRALTRTLAAYRSDAAQKKVFPTDDFRADTSISRSVNINWP